MADDPKLVCGWCGKEEIQDATAVEMSERMYPGVTERMKNKTDTEGLCTPCSAKALSLGVLFIRALTDPDNLSQARGDLMHAAQRCGLPLAFTKSGGVTVVGKEGKRV